MAEWKKVVVSGSDISQLNNDANYLIQGQDGAYLTGSFSGSFIGDLTGTASYATTTISASYATSASFSDTTISASYADNATSASYADSSLSASYATSASHADNATSASYADSALSASYADSSLSASYATSASYADNATSSSYADSALSASYATSASHADNATSASYAPSTPAFPYTGSAEITGSLSVTGSTNLYNSGSAILTVSGSVGELFSITDDNTGDLLTVYSASIPFFTVNSNQSMTITGSAYVTGSLEVTGSLNLTGSQVILNTNELYVYTPNGSEVVSIDGNSGILFRDLNQSASLNVENRELYDSTPSGPLVASLNWDTRQLIKSDGTTVTVDWENGLFSGSFSGSFQGDGSGLTGISASLLFNSASNGSGISTFTFDGSSNVTVEVSGASALSSNTLTKWTGDAFADTSITDDGTLVTFSTDALFQGDITVQGTASFQNAENLLVADRFVLFASGSNTTGDGGIVVQQGTQNIGELYGYDSAAVRWGFTGSFDASSTSYAPEAFIAAVIDVDGGQSDIAKYQKNGNIRVSGSDIYIYA